jgi:hypothetical protein
MMRRPTDIVTSKAVSIDELTIFLGFFFDRYMAGGKLVSPDVHPLNVLRKIEAQSPKKAVIGLKMAVADCLEMSLPWTPTQVTEADSFLSSKGAVTLSDLRRRFRR